VARAATRPTRREPRTSEADVRRLVLARLISFTGTAIAPVALAFALLDAGASGTQLGLVEASSTGMLTVTILFSGVLADRYSRRAVMITADVLALLAQGVTALLVLSHAGSLLAIAAAQAGCGAAAALMYPAQLAALPGLISDPDRRQRATALAGLAESGGMVTGGALAGILVATVGTGVALTLDAASFAVSALLIARIRSPLRPGGQRAGSMLTELREGWRAGLSRPWFVIVLVQFAIVNAAEVGGFDVLGPLRLHQRPHGAMLWAVIATAGSVGLVLGTALMMRLRVRRPLLAGGVAMLATPLPVLLLGAGAPIAVVAAGGMVAGVSYGVFMTCWELSMQQHIPGPLLSRLAAYDMLVSVAATPVGAAVSGPLGALVGLSWAMLGLGLLSLLASAAALLSRSVRTLPRLGESDATSAVR
jgi:predicted MFS family arabinose efflux permease